MKSSLILAAYLMAILILGPFAQAKNSSSAKQQSPQKRAQAKLEDQELDSNPSFEAAIVKQAQSELEQTEKALEQADAKLMKAAEANRTIASLDQAKFKSIDLPSPLKKEDLSKSEGDEEKVKRQEPTVSEKQASRDLQNAEKTLKDLRKESRIKKGIHVKTKQELQQDREDEEYRRAIAKAYKDHVGKKDKSQIVHTSKGNVKVVFINESEFAGTNPIEKSAEISPQLKEALKARDREPANVDNEIDRVVQERDSRFDKELDR